MSYSTINCVRRTAASYQWLVQDIIVRNNATVASQNVLKENIGSKPSSDIDPEWRNAKPYDEIPGLRSFPVIGTSWVLFPYVGAGIPIAREFDLMKQHFKNFGPIWKDSFPVLPQLVSTTRPEDAEKVFRADGRLPNRPGVDILGAYRTKRVENFTLKGILVDNGEDWWKIRSKAQQPFLKNQNVLHYAPVLGRIADEFIERMKLIRKENMELPDNFINDMYRWALESVAVVGLNTRLGCLDPNLAADSDAQKMIDATNYSFNALFELQFSLPIWKYVKTPMMRKFFEAQDVLTDTSIKYISRTMEAIKKRDPDSDEDLSILEQLLIRGMTLSEAVVMVIDMLMAGIDTTSNSTAFLLYYLATNPDKQKILREEIFNVVGKNSNNITQSQLNELHYLKACVKETLRLRPAVAGNIRVIDKDLILSGYQVPKGTTVRLLHQFTGQLEEYFPDHQKFIPERWIKGHPLESQHHSYALLPFGFGTRMCIGRRLAELEMWQLTTKILQNFEIQYHHEDIGWITRAVNTPDQPLRFKIIDLD